MGKVIPNPNNCSIIPTYKKLNTNKIKDIEDIKRVLEFLNITAIDDGHMQSHGFEKVKDLFE
jgi:hypothetical protein